ncbi:MAG: rod-binding protein [Wigglesworthia glossinidia]|nr:rod-binding protein [Wigglesworthia glossinidia]
MNNTIFLKNTTYNAFEQLDNAQYKSNDIKNYSSEKIESLFVNLMIKSMRSTHLEENLLNSEQKNLYESIYDQILSDQISQKSIGLKKFFHENFFQKI